MSYELLSDEPIPPTTGILITDSDGDELKVKGSPLHWGNVIVTSHPRDSSGAWLSREDAIALVSVLQGAIDNGWPE